MTLPMRVACLTLAVIVAAFVMPAFAPPAPFPWPDVQTMATDGQVVAGACAGRPVMAVVARRGGHTYVLWGAQGRAVVAVWDGDEPEGTPARLMFGALDARGVFTTERLVVYDAAQHDGGPCPALYPAGPKETT